MYSFEGRMFMEKDREWHKSERLSIRNRLTLIGVRRIAKNMGYRAAIKKDILIVDTGKKHYYLDVYDDMWRMRCADPYLGSNFIFLPTPSECLSWIKNDLYPEYDYPNPADYI
jgi:hypothetical protein